MDISNTIIANSDQINAADLTGNPITVTIREVTKGDRDQPVHVHLREVEDKTWRPSKSMRRVMVKLWGPDASQYAGKRVTLYNDPSVKWAGQAVGGVRISHASGINGPVSIPLQVARGKSEKFTVLVLADEPQPAQSDPIEKALTDSWDDVERMRKAVAHLAEVDHPLHQKAADRLAELEGAES